MNIGFFNVFKMALAKGDQKGIEIGEAKMRLMDTRIAGQVNDAMKLSIIPFFIIHYGGFMLGHLVFLLAFFASGIWASGSLLEILGALIIGFLALFASHAISFYTNYIAGKEYEHANVKTLMFSPYGRIVVMHLTIIFGAFLNAPLVILMLGNTMADLIAHLNERRGFAQIE